MANCKWCHKHFHVSKKYRKYCSVYCRKASKKLFGGKKKSKYIKEKFWSPHQKKLVLLKSSYESTYARYLSLNGIKWLYEAKRFYLEEDRKHYYIPDFYLPETNEFHEVKGRWYKKSLIKVESFRKLYPEEKLIIIGTPEIMEIRKNMRKLYGDQTV